MYRTSRPVAARLPRCLLTAAVVALCGQISLPAAFAQAANDQSETRTGKLVEAKKKGQTVTLVVDVGGKEEQFVLNARVEFAITAAGDEGFLREEAFVSTVATISNDKLFAQNYTVHVGPGAKKMKAMAEKAPAKPGFGRNDWIVAGEVASRKPHEQFTDYDELTLKVKGKTPVLVDRTKPRTITVSSDDVEMAAPGSAVDLVGRPGPGGKFLLTAATVKLAAPLKADEFYAAAEEKKK